MRGEQLHERLIDELARREQARGLRCRRALRVLDATHVEVGGQILTQFASNDYLGLTHHPRILAAAEECVRAGGAGSGASGLVTGYSIEHAEAEKTIAAWKGTEAAVLLPSGYQTAHAAIQTLTGGCFSESGSVRFLIDKLCHASLIDAIGGSGAPFRVFPHNHLGKLERLLADAPTKQLQVVVTESIFSMDGDAADLRGLADLKQRHGFVLLLDEAHGSGVYGPAGAGYAAECGLQSTVDISIVTLSKAVGVSGGAVCASQAFCDALVNWGRAYIYSTQTPPMIAAAVRASIQVMRDEPQRQDRLRQLSRKVRAALAAGGATRNQLPALPSPDDSPIIPVILGSEDRALRAAQSLREAGLLIPAIRPPTVPRGASRLRITLSCAHTDADVEILIEQVARLA